MTVYFTIDQYFGHAAARSFYRRPFMSVTQMDQKMIDQWNSVVRPGDEDEIWHLGDFAVRLMECHPIHARLAILI